MNGEEIKRLRKSLKMTQVEFAKTLYVTPHTIYRWETGKSEPHPINKKQLTELKEARINRL